MAKTVVVVEITGFSVRNGIVSQKFSWDSIFELAGSEFPSSSLLQTPWLG